MTRPALLALLLVSAAALPAHAARCDQARLAKLAGGDASDAEALETVEGRVRLKTPSALCGEAVWKFLALPGPQRWFRPETLKDPNVKYFASEAGKLAELGALYDALDGDAAAVDRAAADVYAAAKALGVLTGEAPNLAVADKIDMPDEKDLKRAAEAKTKVEALAKLVTPAKPATGTSKAQPAKEGALIVAFYQALQKARADAEKARSSGADTPASRNVWLNNELAREYPANALTIAAAGDDKSALTVFQDAALRDKVGAHAALVGKIVALVGTQGAGALDKGGKLSENQRKALEGANAALRDQIKKAVGLDTAQQVFDNDRKREGFEQSAEGVYQKRQLSAADAAVQSAQIVQTADGKYQIQYKDAKTGEVKTAAKDLPDLKAATDSFAAVTDEIKKNILDNNTMLAKTAALKGAVQDIPTPGFAAAAGPGAGLLPAGCPGSKGETMSDYQSRLNSEQMKKAGEGSAERMRISRQMDAELRKIDEEYPDNVQAMGKDKADKYKADAIAAVNKKYLGPGGALSNLDEAFARRAVGEQLSQSAAEGAFLAKIRLQAPQLKEKMPGNLHKYVEQRGLRQALLRPIPDGDGKSHTAFDEYYEKVWGEDFSQTSRDCLKSYRADNYDSLEECAGDKLKAWLAARSRGPESKTDRDGLVRQGQGK